MNKHSTIGTLALALTMGACCPLTPQKTEVPAPKPCQQVQLEDGMYHGISELDNPILYFVSTNNQNERSCTAFYILKSHNISITDFGCDDTIDMAGDEAVTPYHSPFLTHARQFACYENKLDR